MTATSLRAKKRTLAVSKSSLQRARSLAMQQAAPSRPKVTGGPRCYGLTPKGKRVVARVWVTQYQGYRKTNRWFVMDFEEGVRGEANGYRSKRDAIEVAKRLRDTLPSPYSRSAF